MNAKEIAKFIKDAVKDLSVSDRAATYYLKLDNDFAIYVGWSGGFDPKDEGCFHSKSHPEYCLCAKVAEWNPMDVDYEWMCMPWYEDGEVWDSEITLSTKGYYYDTAVWLNKNYRGMRRDYRMGLIRF